MSRSDRMFEIIQVLRAATAPVTADMLAQALEVTKRTVYRDIAALQGQRVPIEGEAGVGYIMRPGFDLPPLMFTPDEIEAIAVGLAMLRRSGDAGLLNAANRVAQKIGEVLPPDREGDVDRAPLYVSGWNAIPSAAIDPDQVRKAIREEQALLLNYSDVEGKATERAILPLAVVYYIDALVLAGWCELRKDFRHFRIDRIQSCKDAGRSFKGKGAALRKAWQAQTDTI